MKICSVNLYYSVAAANESPTAFLERMPLLRDVPASMAAAGNEVNVVQLFPSEQTFTQDGVNYHFVRPSLLEKGAAQAASWVHGRSWPWHVAALSAVRRVLGFQSDVIHFHRLSLSTTLYLLQLLRGKDGPAVVAHYHGDRAAEGWLARKFQMAGLRQTQRVLFGRRDAADPFLQDGLLEEKQVVEINDRSTNLTMQSRPEARQESGMQGSPVFLWYSNLDQDRDPMTAVLGFEQLLKAWPKAQLYIHYKGDDLLTQLRAYVVAHPHLAPHVHFRSRKHNRELDDSPAAIFNSADFLLQTDRVANNGHALLEAMACGVIPVVSDIPTFRTLLDNGRCGFLFPQGDSRALSKQLLKISPGKIAGRAALVHDWFETAYSYDAMAGLLLDLYAQAIGERRALAEASHEPLTEGSG